MPKAEVGSTKYLNNKLKSKGLQRLRWYCQVCEKQMRDENGFKCHTQSEGHVRQMLVVGENSHRFISDYSAQFKRDFLQLLRTSHGEKKIHINHFYQEYISSKEHIHMNATRWPSLTEFAKFLGREGICRVEEGEKGLEIAWIDNSPESLRRQDAIRKKERQDKGDEDREQRLIRAQVLRARREAEEKGVPELDEQAMTLQREEGEKIILSFGGKISPKESNKDSSKETDKDTSTSNSAHASSISCEESLPTTLPITPEAVPNANLTSERVSLQIGLNKPKNVFAAASKKNALGSKKSNIKATQPKPMSEAERIMKEEIERKRFREASGLSGFANKRQRV